LFHRRTPLHHASWHGAHRCVEFLLGTEAGRADINALDSDDPHQPERYTPLMLGISHGAPLVKALLCSGASVSHVTERLRCNLLHRAVSRTNHLHHGFVPFDLPVIVQMVIDAPGGGCDVNARDASGDTPLSLLCAQVKTFSVQIMYLKCLLLFI